MLLCCIFCFTVAGVPRSDQLFVPVVVKWICIVSLVVLMQLNLNVALRCTVLLTKVESSVPRLVFDQRDLVLNPPLPFRCIMSPLAATDGSSSARRRPKLFNRIRTSLLQVLREVIVLHAPCFELKRRNHYSVQHVLVRRSRQKVHLECSTRGFGGVPAHSAEHPLDEASVLRAIQPRLFL